MAVAPPMGRQTLVLVTDCLKNTATDAIEARLSPRCSGKAGCSIAGRHGTSSAQFYYNETFAPGRADAGRLVISGLWHPASVALLLGAGPFGTPCETYG